MEGESVDSPTSASDDNRVSILKKAFEVYDVDGSGSIDYSEFKRLIQDLGWPAHEEFIDRAVRVLDQDLSGEIEFSEFQKWTEFAYASRILYRQEMYGLGPRSSSVNGGNMEPVIHEAHDGKQALVIRRTSLTTVFEEKEHAEQGKQGSDSDSGGPDDEEEKEDGVGPGLKFYSSGSSNARDQDRDVKPSSPSMLRLCNRKSSPHIPSREVNNICSSSLSRREGGGDQSSGANCQDLVEKNEGILSDGEKIPAFRSIDAPIREMATMVLSTGRRGRGTHTSRSRAKSVGILRSRRSSGVDAGVSGYIDNKSGDVAELGPRTESKMTVRMRFACGQFERQKGEEKERSGSESGEELRSDELLKAEKEICSKSNEANGTHRRDGRRDGRDKHVRTRRSVEWKDKVTDGRNRDRE